jgi:hypothetical protein
MASLEERIEEEVAALGDLSREDLVARWIKAYGCPPPKGVKRGLLESAAAWLSPGAKRAIRDAVKLHRDAGSRTEALPNIAEAAYPNQDVTLPKPVASNSITVVTSASLKPGTRLVREWNGRTHVVDVSEDGFVFDGKTYTSLSAIAKRITGAHWSGARFFGL